MELTALVRHSIGVGEKGRGHGVKRGKNKGKAHFLESGKSLRIARFISSEIQIDMQGPTNIYRQQ